MRLVTLNAEMPKKFSLPLIFASISLILIACGGEPEPRRYTEVAPRPPEGVVRNEAPIDIQWSLPGGWSVQPEGDPLRLVGFRAPPPGEARSGSDARAADVSLVQLAGDGGGTRANVTRWLGQVGLSASLADEAVAAAVPVQTRSGENGIVVDFTDMLSDDLTQSKSIIAAIIEGDGFTVFVRALGERDHLAAIKGQLLEFCRSLTIEEKAQ